MINDKTIKFRSSLFSAESALPKTLFILFRVSRIQVIV